MRLVRSWEAARFFFSHFCRFFFYFLTIVHRVAHVCVTRRRHTRAQTPEAAQQPGNGGVNNGIVGLCRVFYFSGFTITIPV